MDDLVKHNIYKKIFFKIPGSVRCKISHYRMHRRFGNHSYLMDLKNPKTFNEKITWLKLNYRQELAKKIADKYLVREYVEEKVGREYLIPVIDVYLHPNQIDYSILPNQFVLKPNHGSGWVIICMDKATANFKAYNNRLKNWFKIDFYYLSDEWQYHKMEKKIICETLIQDLADVIDYKIYCFKGIPRFVQVDLDRHTQHKRSFYDLNWRKMDIGLLYPDSKEILEKPKRFSEMLEVASALASELPFCRVDLYNVEGKILFGEITLHPEAGNGPFETYEQDLRLGEMLDINDIPSNNRK